MNGTLAVELLALGVHLLLEIVLLVYFVGKTTEKVKGLDVRVKRIEEIFDSFLTGLVKAEFDLTKVRERRKE